MHDVPLAGQRRRFPPTRPDVPRSGLVGGALATEARIERASGSRRTSRSGRPSDAVTAECVCPEACIRDHEHE